MLLVSRLRILQGLMILTTAGSLMACRKEAPRKPAPVVVKKSPAEIKQLADSASQSLEGLKQPIGALSAKFKDLHQRFDGLPPDLPEFGLLRGKFYSADEGIGRLSAKIPWLTGQIEAAVKAGDGAELEEISKSIDRTYAELPEIDQLATELLHEVMPFTRIAAELEARRKAACESDNTGAITAAAAAAMSKKAPAR
ncbi:MAG TPA: hypothetical protein VJV79_02520 [Polyangiaceae bacterium]|nr:hypothetical protein [Polyangiaceae bacterium]